MPYLGPFMYIHLNRPMKFVGHGTQLQLLEGPHPPHPLREGGQEGAAHDDEADEGCHGPLRQSQTPEPRQVLKYNTNIFAPAWKNIII